LKCQDNFCVCYQIATISRDVWCACGFFLFLFFKSDPVQTAYPRGEKSGGGRQSRFVPSMGPVITGQWQYGTPALGAFGQGGPPGLANGRARAYCRRQLLANAAIAASRVPARCNSFASAVISCPPVQPTTYQSKCKEKGRQMGGLVLGRHVMKTRQVPLLLHSRRDNDPQLGGNGRTTGAYVVKWRRDQ
jgi:hypothetical protein